MPNKKASRNAYFYFVLDMIPELRRRGLPVSGVKEAIPLCSGDWALLSVQEKEKYADKAKAWRSRETDPPGPHTNGASFHQEKEQKSSAAGGGDLTEPDWCRRRPPGVLQPPCGQRVPAPASDWLMRSHGLYDMAARRDLIGEQGDAGSPQDVKDLDKCVIYILNIFSHGEMPSLCEQRYVPCEVGCVRYSLQSGVMDSFHHFIDPGELPLGFRYHCQAGSAATHQIPVSGFELANRDYHNLFRALCDFVCPSSKRWTSVYCKNNDLHRIQWCLQWLAVKAGMENLFELRDVESLIIQFYRSKLSEEPSKSSVHRLLDVVHWDYANNTRCKWHEDNDLWYCALASCKKVTYCISRALASVYDVILTAAHLPNLQANNNQKSENSKTVVLDAKRYQKKMDRPHLDENGNSAGAVGGEGSLGMRGVGSIPTSKARGRGILRLLEDMPPPYISSA